MYFDETGLYFDYDDNLRNDARNEIDDVKKWFVWVKAREEQRPMAEMEKQCDEGEANRKRKRRKKAVAYLYHAAMMVTAIHKRTSDQARC